MNPNLCRCLMCIVLIFAAVGAVSAQEDAAEVLRRDPRVLAERFLGVEGEIALPDITPILQPGEEMQFWVGKAAHTEPVQITARLAAAFGSVYLWVEDGIDVRAPNLGGMAQSLSRLYNLYRTRTNYIGATIPGIGQITDPRDLLPVPDVDNDPHLYIVFATGLTDDASVIANPLDSLLTPLAPSGYSNLHETLFVNAAAYPDSAFDSLPYFNLIARALYGYVMNANNPDGALWLKEALGWLLFFQTQEIRPGSGDFAPFLAAPDTPLTRPATASTRSTALGAQQLFINYLFQRYGARAFLDLFFSQGENLSALDAIFEANNINDPATGATVTAADAFADFTLANLLNADFGDRRYTHTISQLEPGQRAAAVPINVSGTLTAQTVNQYGTVYYFYPAQQAQTVELRFSGRETSARFFMPDDRDAVDRFYWSGAGKDQVRSMTREFDLSSVESAVLTFDIWHNLAEAWNYAYVSASTDGGDTWTILPPEGVTPNNRYGAAYGVGFTGISNPEPVREFPLLGVLIANDGYTIVGVTAGGPADEAGIEIGDAIIGYDGAPWQTAPDVIGLLANYAPGETINLYIQRGSERFDAPVVLGARLIEQPPLWLAQRVDLTPYAGETILLRFDYISLPGHEDQGFAVDNITISEIDFYDAADGESSWDMLGWSQTDNRGEQPMILQAVTTGTDLTPPHVRRLLDPTSETISGKWTFALGAGETLLIAVSGASDQTRERAVYDLALEVVE